MKNTSKVPVPPQQQVTPGATSQVATITPIVKGGWFASVRGRAAPWIATAADTILPLSMGVVAVLVFGLLEQARDALFGALGSPVNQMGKSPRLEGLSLFIYYAIAVVIFGNLLWYTGRAMATTSIRNADDSAGYRRARRHYPRLLAYALMSLLTAVAVFVARDRIEGFGPALIWAAVGLLAPVLVVPLVQRKANGDRRWALWTCILTLAFESLLLAFVQPEGGAWQTIVVLTIASTMPTACYVAWVRRRTWMDIQAKPETLFATHRRRLTHFVAICAVIFLGLAFAPAEFHRALGSPAIVMAALNGTLVGLVAVCLLLRAIERRLPGLVVVGVMAGLAAATLGRLAYNVDPWREIPGNEHVHAAPLASAPAPAPLPDQHIIVVNAYGGGLRAAFFTAAVLARMDDWSCGTFGANLTALSGVSGGSLGIATYLTARQRVVASGGWEACDGKRAVVGALVEEALRRDHLSPVVARMLTLDLLPLVTPQRGQALLDSWDDAIRKASSGDLVLKPTDGLAMPMTALTGGISPVPLVLFNATDARNGEIVWMSNRARWGSITTRKEAKGDQPLDIRVGQAVLHSARFPVVSPVGALANQAGAPALLVDGGLHDVSGATSLSENVPAASYWININGNFDRAPCQGEAPAAGLKNWSTFNALLALRSNLAKQGVESMKGKAVMIDAKLDFDKMLLPQYPNDVERCAAIAQMHAAPLGWYMSVRSAEDMKRAIDDVARTACNQLGPLCAPSQSGAKPL